MNRRPITDDSVVHALRERLHASGPLAGIDPSIIAKVARASELLDLAVGEMLVKEGDPATPEVYVLVDGTLVVQSKGAPIATLDQPGAVIGEVAVMLSAKRTADVVARTAVRAIAVPAEVLTQPEFADVAAGVRSAMLRDDWVQY
jgi:CRP-like cAMP-binding protein